LCTMVGTFSFVVSRKLAGPPCLAPPQFYPPRPGGATCSRPCPQFTQPPQPPAADLDALGPKFARFIRQQEAGTANPERAGRIFGPDKQDRDFGIDRIRAHREAFAFPLRTVRLFW
jgi:hypothetical protein